MVSVPGKTRSLGKGSRRNSAQIKLIEQPYRDKGAATALAKLPEDIQAILKKPEQDRSLLEKQIGALGLPANRI